jgi:hypothetical protein
MRFDYSKREIFEYHVYISKLGFPHSSEWAGDALYFINNKSSKMETRTFQIDMTNIEVNDSYIFMQTSKLRS